MAPVFSVRNYIPARTMPLDVGLVHFVGIGGIGMSGIAEIMHNLGYKVAGSDLSENNNVQRLRDLGIDVKAGQSADNIKDAKVVVKSTAVPYSNPEIMAAREAGIPVVRRSEMLAELTRLKATIAVAGSHGKTTTTSLVSQILEASNMDPTVINGGIINAYGTNAHLGSGDWLIAEADESDGTFINIPATIGIITNLDPEHLDYWGDYDSLKEGFRTFIGNLPFYGFGVLCYDHPEVRALADSIMDRRIMSYGIDSEDVSVRAVNILATEEGAQFDVVISEEASSDAREIKGLMLPIPGKHNVLNALAAIAIALELKLGEEIIRTAFENFKGVKRRFSKVGDVDGITIIDDYAHHPEEVRATLSAARDVMKLRGGRLIAVMQPHRFSRLKDLFNDFLECIGDVHEVIVVPVFSAGEEPIENINSEVLVERLSGNGVNARLLSQNFIDQFSSPSAALADILKGQIEKGDMIVCMGAGSISTWAHQLPSELVKPKASLSSAAV